MTEIQTVYSELINKMKYVTDMNTVIKTDVTLTHLEDSFSELLDGANIFEDCFSDNQSVDMNMCVLGSDGHGITHLLRKMFTHSRIIWIPNVHLFEENYTDSFQALIISDLAMDELLTDISSSMQWKEALIDGGYLLINYGSITIDCLNKWCNNLCFTPFRTYNNNIFSAINSKSPRQETIKFKKEDHKKFKKIYCVCPSLFKTGGTELLHQLVYWINNFGGEAEIAYVNSDESKGFTHPEYTHYVTGHVTRFEDIDDSYENAVVIPEGWPFVCSEVHKAKILFWWLSVDNFISAAGPYLDDAINLIKTKPKIHLVQSEYAKKYALSLGISRKRMLHLADYINDEYLFRKTTSNEYNKQDIVLYNPKKGKDFTEELIKRSKDINWVAIQNMTTAQVADLMRRAKVYVDFGNHPGKDRIPREAAMSGCVVITGRKGSASYYEDVSIPDKYKVDESNASFDNIIDLIRSCIYNYDTVIKDFDEYIHHIQTEKEEFIDDVKKCFFNA